jgi:GT2 family glycosyltransferase
MKIAAIVITFNDDYKFDEWVKHHQVYKHELFLHIIVDNGSKSEYLQLVENTFTESHIIKRTTNGGCTGAYNDGIRFALAYPDVDAIMLIGNDIKLEKGGVTKLYEFLYSSTQYGMISPILLKKDSELVEVYGANINPKKLTFEHQYTDVPLSLISKEFVVSDSLPGGMNLAKRIFYEIVGLQDEYLFMYSDEVDTGIRARKHNLLMVATKNVVSWHQHINPTSSLVRSPLAGFLWGRNEVYLAKKHFGSAFVMSIVWYRIKRSIRTNIGNWIKGKTYDEKKYWRYYLLGIFAGLFNISKLPITK